MPGYRNRRPGREPGYRAGADAPGGPRYGSPADGAVGKGPVRGFPPTPGQPPPMYPPGQFAAWNRVPAARSPRAGTRPGLPGGDAGLPADARASLGQRGQSRQPDRASQAWYGEGGSGGQGDEPGYSVLAVSDPAADVTSTQTWEAIGDGPDGRAAGTWADPRGAAGQPPPGAQVTGAQVTAGGRAGPQTAAPAAGHAPATGPAAATTAAGPAVRSHSARPGGTRAAGSRAAGSRAAGSRAAGSRAAGSRASGARSARSSNKGRQPSSAALAVCAVLVLAVAAAAFLLYIARRQGSTTAVAPASSPTASASTPAPTPSATLGPFGHIASRAADPLPLKITQLFPRTFTAAGASFARTISQQGKSCTSVVVGASLQSAVKAAKCNQVVRASYLSTAKKEMGTIGVLNLGTSKMAEHAGRAAGATDFIAQLRARKGATHELGKGTGIEEAETKGHYLILIWAQFTSRRKPKTPGQRKELEHFMSYLFQRTANVSLTSRMVDGKP